MGEILRGGDEVGSVLLKSQNCFTEDNYYVKAWQPLGSAKFQSMKLHRVYCIVKSCRKILGKSKELSTYMVKRTLRKPKFLHIEETSNSFDDLGSAQAILFLIA